MIGKQLREGLSSGRVAVGVALALTARRGEQRDERVLHTAAEAEAHVQCIVQMNDDEPRLLSIRLEARRLVDAFVLVIRT